MAAIGVALNLFVIRTPFGNSLRTACCCNCQCECTYEPNIASISTDELKTRRTARVLSTKISWSCSTTSTCTDKSCSTTLFRLSRRLVQVQGKIRVWFNKEEKIVQRLVYLHTTKTAILPKPWPECFGCLSSRRGRGPEVSRVIVVNVTEPASTADQPPGNSAAVNKCSTSLPPKNITPEQYERNYWDRVRAAFTP